MSRRKVDAIRQSIKNILALPDRLRTCSPIHGAASAKQNERGLFSERFCGVHFSRVQPPRGHAHPFPLHTPPRKIQQFAGLTLRQHLRMNHIWSSSHGAPQLARDHRANRQCEGSGERPASAMCFAIRSKGNRTARENFCPATTRRHSLANRLDCSPEIRVLGNEFVEAPLAAKCFLIERGRPLRMPPVLKHVLHLHRSHPRQ